MADRLVRRINGPRGSVLLAGSMICLMHAIAYSWLIVPPYSTPAGLQLLGQAVPLNVYAGCWLAAAIVAYFGALTTRTGKPRELAQTWGYGLLIGMLVLWGSAFLIGFGVTLFSDALPGAERSWVAGGMYLGVAWLTAESLRLENAVPPMPPRTRRRRAFHSWKIVR